MCLRCLNTCLTCFMNLFHSFRVQSLKFLRLHFFLSCIVGVVVGGEVVVVAVVDVVVVGHDIVIPNLLSSRFLRTLLRVLFSKLGNGRKKPLEFSKAIRPIRATKMITLVRVSICLVAYEEVK